MGLKAPVTLLLATVLGVLAAVWPAAAAPVSIVGLGDSLMAGYRLPAEDGFPAQLQAALRKKGLDVTVENAGVSGDTTSDGLARIDWSVPDGTDAVILELGGNDALRGIAPATTRANLQAMVDRLKGRGIPVLLVGIVAPPNMGTDYAEAFNPIFGDIAGRNGLVFYPFFLDGVATHAELQLDDGLHPNAKGVAVMVQRFLPYAERLVTQAVAARDNR